MSMSENLYGTVEQGSQLSPLFQSDAFSRIDSSDDRHFYARDRFVSHLDNVALDTVMHLIRTVIVEDKPEILDLMAGWDSHIPDDVRPKRVVGLGLNKNELSKNKSVTEMVLHDLNKDPKLPFSSECFDVVINTVSVDYMVKPMEVFREVGRILRPGGLFLVIFSNRMFAEKAVKVWRESSEEERVILVEELFSLSDQFNKPEVFLSKGRPRPKNDKYAHLGIPSDPIYAVYAEKRGSVSKRRGMGLKHMVRTDQKHARVLEQRKAQVKHSLRCPYCGEKLNKWAVPDNPFSQTWDNDFMYICFNNACPYYVSGWDFMYKNGNSGVSYRLMYNPEKDRCMPIPVPSPYALKDGIIE